MFFQKLLKCLNHSFLGPSTEFSACTCKAAGSSLISPFATSARTQGCDETRKSSKPYCDRCLSLRIGILEWFHVPSCFAFCQACHVLNPMKHDSVSSTRQHDNNAMNLNLSLSLFKNNQVVQQLGTNPQNTTELGNVDFQRVSPRSRNPHFPQLQGMMLMFFFWLLSLASLWEKILGSFHRRHHFQNGAWWQRHAKRVQLRIDSFEAGILTPPSKGIFIKIGHKELLSILKIIPRYRQ